MARELRVTAPAKVILHGEHSVVYGKTALAASVDLRTQLVIKASVCGQVRLLLPDLGREYSWAPEDLRSLISRGTPPHLDQPSPICQAFVARLRQFIADLEPDSGVVAFLHLFLSLLPSCPPLTFTISSDIPLGAGLGSSAAMSVCLAAGLFMLASRSDWMARLQAPNTVGADPQGVPDSNLTESERAVSCGWAYTAEQIMHGTPSGIDNSVATHGGVVSYRAGAMEPLQDLAGLQVLLTDTRVPRNTKELVARVRSQHNSLPAVVEPILEAMDQVSIAALDILRQCREKKFLNCKQQFETLERLVDTNHSLLSSLGVSHPALEQVRTLAAVHGLHTKLTGAGGGGVAYSLVTPDTEEHQVAGALAALQAAGFKCYRAAIGGPGVCLAWQ